MVARPGIWNTEAHVGSRFHRTITHSVKVGESYEPVDLTGYSARYVVRQGSESGPLIVQVTDGAGISLGGPTGTIEIDIAATTTVDWPTSERAVHDLHLTPPSGAANEFKLLTGRMFVKDQVEPEVSP